MMVEHGQLETALDALSHPYRRQLLVALLEANPQDDDDTDPMNLLDGEDESEVLETSLYHAHLPKLEDLGFIDWDKETGQISTGPEWEHIEPLLQLIENHSDELPDDWL
jgi:hypothetical protein